MNPNSAARNFDFGKVIVKGQIKKAGEIEWSAHPRFRGVFLKHLVVGEDVDNLISCHLVRVDPGCELSPHIHEGQGELHEILEGSAVGITAGGEIEYRPGLVTYIPKGVEHSVKAGDKGVVLFAKFIPPLM